MSVSTVNMPSVGIKVTNVFIDLDAATRSADADLYTDVYFQFDSIESAIKADKVFEKFKPDLKCYADFACLDMQEILLGKESIEDNSNFHQVCSIRNIRLSYNASRKEKGYLNNYSFIYDVLNKLNEKNKQGIKISHCNFDHDFVTQGHRSRNKINKINVKDTL